MLLPSYKTDHLTITLRAPYASLVPELQPPSSYWKLQSPYCQFHFNYRSRSQPPPQHSTFQVSLETRTSLTARAYRIGFSDDQTVQKALSPCQRLPNLAGQAMSNDNGVWVNPFGFVISSIIPFIEGPGVINKQNSEWWSNYTTGRDGRLQHRWLRGAQWLPCSDACNYLLCWRCDVWGGGRRGKGGTQ